MLSSWLLVERGDAFPMSSSEMFALIQNGFDKEK